MESVSLVMTLIALNAQIKTKDPARLVMSVIIFKVMEVVNSNRVAIQIVMDHHHHLPLGTFLLAKTMFTQVNLL